MSSKPPRRPARRNDPALSRARAAAAPPRRRAGRAWQDNREQMLLFVGAGVIALIVAGILGFGWWHDHVYEPSRSIAQINRTTITGGDLLAEMQIEATYLRASLAASYQGQDVPPDAQDQLTQNLSSLPDQDYTELVTWTLEDQEAPQVGVTVTQDEIDQRVGQDAAQVIFQKTPQPTPTLDVAAATAAVVAVNQTATAVTAATGTATALAASGEATPSPTATATATATPSVTLTPSDTPTPVPTTTPLPTPLPTDQAQVLQQQTGLPVSQYATLVRHTLVDQKLQQYFASTVPTSQAQVHARHIVLADQTTANQVLQQLQGGADFATLAQQDSTDTATKSSGGDMGWLPKGIQGPEFDNVVFALAVGQLSDVFSTPAGYQIAQVLEQDPNRPVDPSQLSQLQSAAYSNWLTGTKQAANVPAQLDPEIATWALGEIGVRS